MGLEVWIEMAREWHIDNVIKKSTITPHPFSSSTRSGHQLLTGLYILADNNNYSVWMVRAKESICSRSTVSLKVVFVLCVFSPSSYITFKRTQWSLAKLSPLKLSSYLGKSFIVRLNSVATKVLLPSKRMKKSHKHRILLWPSGVRIVENQLILLCQNH